MNAWLMDDFRGVAHLRFGEAAEPAPQPKEVVLQLHYAGLNPADAYLAERLYPARPPLPHILGRDGLGTVIQLGSEVAGVELGAKRALLRGDAGVNRPGTFAERVAVPADCLVELPRGWTDAEGAGAPLVYLTAFQALTMWGPLPEKSVVLVTGASGGVGVAAIQLAGAMGYRVIVLSRSEEKCARLLQLGAEAAFNPSDARWRQAAKARFAPGRVELAVDTVGGKLLAEVIDTLGDLGKVSIVGRLAGPVPEFNTAALIFRRIRIGGVAVSAYTHEESRRAWGQVTALLDRGNARPLVDSVWEFAQLPQAFARLAEGPMGKVLMRVG